MDQQLIRRIVEEVRTEANGRFFGKIFQLGPLSFALDLGLKSRFLYLSAEPSSPRFYLVEKKVRELEKQSTQLTQFGQLMKSLLGGGRFIGVGKDRGERVVRMSFQLQDEIGNLSYRRLVVQLTGRAANLLIIDELNRIVTTLRPPRGYGQSPGEQYSVPPTPALSRPEEPIPIEGSPSAAAVKFFETQGHAHEFNSVLNNLRGQLKKVLGQKTKLKKNLEQDLDSHGDPEVHKKLGDLLLANIATAERVGQKVKVTDFYSENTPLIELEIDENDSIQEAANQFFRRYSKAKRAREEISERLVALNRELEELNVHERELNRIAAEHDEEALRRVSPSPDSKPTKKRAKPEPTIPGVRKYESTDGFEVLVGRAAKDNDNLTFRIAKPNDLWLHAGDYPGSHVVVRNPNRKEIPQRTIIEAAQLAARFSQASEDSKVVIHYTQRKFISKPKGAAPGLVRLSSFRSITVEPKEGIKRI
jgi:predicted ribosome quality control (RQC) complex YloA/Tae2 family protein